MIRVYKLETENHVYYGIEVDPRADIITKHKRYRFNEDVANELNGLWCLTILHETKSLHTAEKLEQYYKRNSPSQN